MPNPVGEWLDHALAGIHAKLDLVLAKLDAEPEPDPDPDPAIGVEVNAFPLNSHQVRVEWSTTRDDITGWHVGRDGADSAGSGPWSTDSPASARSHVFNLLVPDTEYTFTLVPHTAAGELEALTATATPGGADPDPGPGPGPGPAPGEDGPTAAARLGWGTPHPISDEFTGGQLDLAKWQLPNNWPGHAGNGRRIADCVQVRDGMMVLEGRSNGDTGWVRQRLDVKHGRWEIRSRSRNTGHSGGLYHPLHLIWARDGKGGDHPFPQGGEYDWLEYFDPDAKKASAFLHYPHNPGAVQQEYVEKGGVDMTQFHNFAFEWTADHLRGWIDGEQWFSRSGGATSTRKNIQDMPMGALTIQLDNFIGDGGLRPAVFEVQWVRFYPL